MLKLIISPDPVLTQSAIDWNFEIDGNAVELEQQMLAVMVNQQHAIGLAANQVGILKRVFTIQLQNHPSITEPFAMFNPAIISVNENLILSQEGCISFPNLWLEVKRPESIVSEYFDKLGNKCIIELSGIDARCFLHELDHLNGICFTDKVSQLRLALARKKQQKRKHNG